MKKLFYLLLAPCLAMSLFAKTYIKGNTTRNPLSYQVGEEITFVFSLVDDEKIVPGKKLHVIFETDDGQHETFEVTTDKKRSKTFTMSKPGFARFQIYPKEADGSELKDVEYFDGGAGAGVDQIFPACPAPADFNEFWDGWIAKLEATEPEIKLTPMEPNVPGTLLFEFEVSTLPGFAPATGVLCYPENAADKSLPITVPFDGYTAPAAVYLPSHDAVKNQIYVRTNRQPISNQGDAAYYEEQKKIYTSFCFRNNDKPETSDFLGMMLRDYRGIQLAQSLPCSNGHTMLHGGSMGACRALAMAALAPNIDQCGINIPWCCDLGGVTQGRLGGWRPAFTEALLYFDPCSMATRIKCPVIINQAGIGDYVSPASSVMALFNTLKSHVQVTFTQSMKHGGGEHPKAPRYFMARNFDDSTLLLEPLPGMTKDIRTLPISIGEYCSTSYRDGHTILTVNVPENSEARYSTCFGMRLDPAPMLNKTVCMQIRFRTENVNEPDLEYLGTKFMLVCQGAPGVPIAYHDSFLPQGTHDWNFGYIYQKIEPKLNQAASLTLGLQSVHGIIEFELDSLECGIIYTPAQRKYLDYETHYSGQAEKTVRGVMSSGAMTTEKDLATLHEWGANVMRYQLMRNWLGFGTERDLDEYYQWLDKKMDNIEEMSKLYDKYGVQFIIDMHSPPGGKSGWYNMSIFSEPVYTEAYLDCWRKIATRFKGNPAIYAFDLINEPFQGAPSKDSGFWDLQYRAAKEIRAIDPDRVICVTPLYGGISGLDILSLIPMDNIIYTVHTYPPGEFTHPGNDGSVVYPGMIAGEYWDKERLRKFLKPLRDFQQEHNVKIYIGEFSAVVWAPGADKWLEDLTSIFEEYGWSWTYHAFREWAGWSLEHEGTNEHDLHPSKDNPRKQVMLKAFQKNKN